ncbi:MAG TPA: ABC transporter permease [Actinomycetota bacterium]|nr:ABC transporter permease [Actinomycetota bacterium]
MADIKQGRPPTEEEEEPRASGEETAGASRSFASDVLEGGAGPSWLRALSIPVLAILTALVLGALLIVFTDSTSLHAWASFFRDPIGALSASWTAVREAYQALFTGALGSPSEIAGAIGSGDLHRITLSLNPLSETVIASTPLIFAGLSVALGFRAGLFNIGAEGQINVGAIAAASVGFSFAGLPGPLHLTLIVGAGFLGGALWGGIPGYLKAKTGAHEVITTIMMNYISYYLVDYLLLSSFFQRPGRTDPISKPVTAFFPHLLGQDLRLNAGIFVALLMAIVTAWLLNRSTVGFQFKAVGANPDAARTAGMSPGRTFVWAMALSGALAGLGGAVQLASVSPSLTPGFSSGYGFDAIALALLGKAKPSGVVAAAFLLGALRAGARSMQAATSTPIDIVTVIEALVIVFVAAPAVVRGIYRIKAQRAEGPQVLTKGWGA